MALSGGGSRRRRAARKAADYDPARTRRNRRPLGPSHSSSGVAFHQALKKAETASCKVAREELFAALYPTKYQPEAVKAKALSMFQKTLNKVSRRCHW